MRVRVAKHKRDQIARGSIPNFDGMARSVKGVLDISEEGDVTESDATRQWREGIPPPRLQRRAEPERRGKRRARSHNREPPPERKVRRIRADSDSE